MSGLSENFINQNFLKLSFYPAEDKEIRVSNKTLFDWENDTVQLIVCPSSSKLANSSQANIISTTTYLVAKKMQQANFSTFLNKLVQNHKLHGYTDGFSYVQVHTLQVLLMFKSGGCSDWW